MTRPEAVIFDWGGTLSDYAAVELADMWHLAAEHLAPHMPEDEAAVMRRLGRIEQAFWERTTTDQRSGTLADLLSAATSELGIDVAEAVMEEAAVRYLDAWTPHIVHDPEAAPTLAALRERGPQDRPALKHPLAARVPRALPRTRWPCRA